MRKRLLAIIATVAMVVAMMPSMVFATPVTTEAELSAAFANGGEITLESDVPVSGTLTVPAGKTVTLDLNGNTISGTCNTGSGYLILVENTGTLNIKDSSGDGAIVYTSGTSNVGWAIALKGKLNLYSGTIEAAGSWSIGYAVDVRPNSWGTEYTEGTVFHMYGGKLISGESGIRIASSSADGGSDGSGGYYPVHENVSATFIMDGGEIEAKRDGIFMQQSNGAYDILKVEINDGTIAGGKSPIRFYGASEKESVVNNIESPMTVNINGGDFVFNNTEETATWLVPNVFAIGGGAITKDTLATDATIDISSGTFDGDVSAYLADGLVQDETGKVIDPNAPAEDNDEQNKPVLEQTKPEASPKTGDNSMAPFAVAGLVLAAMAAVVATRRRAS